MVVLKNKTLAALKKRRQDAQMALDDIMEELYSDGEFKAAYTAERELEIAFVRFQAKGGDGKIVSELEAAKKVTDGILAKKGYKRSDLSVKPFCSVCGDTGVVNGRACDCVEGIEKEIIFGERVITAKSTFFDDNERNFDNIKVIKSAKKWCEEFGTGADVKVNYLICGHTGVGKSFLTDCMVNALTEKGVNVVYLTAYELSRMLLDDLNERGNTLVDGLCRVKVLVIDDLGKEPIYNKVSLEGLYCLLNERAVKGLSTVVNTNLEPDGILARYGESILARLANTRTTHVVKLKGNDKRLKI